MSLVNSLIGGTFQKAHLVNPRDDFGESHIAPGRDSRRAPPSINRGACQGFSCSFINLKLLVRVL